MKKLFTLIVLITAISASSFSQYGYIPEKLTGNLYYRDLTNPGSASLIGTTVTQLGGSDFDLSGNLYGIVESTGAFYQIDTATAAASLIATIAPPGAEFWSGMACDPTDGTMYICSTDGNGNTFYSIDVTNGATTLVGTNAVEDGVVGIAFTDDGQMYAIYLVRKFYKIDKTNATPTFVGNLSTAVTAFPHHGLDFDTQTQTMFMVSYNAFSFDNELWTVDVTTGLNTLVGSIGVWAGTIAVEPGFAAGFSADNTEVCEGDVVNFTDESVGAPISWSWTFQGGTPAASTAQNPAVTYNTAGTFDVTLEISDGSAISTLLMNDYISVEAIPVQAATPTGPDETCGGGAYSYNTTSISNATSYEWMVEPSDAGTITGTGTTGTYNAASNWTGAYTVKVRGANECGDGPWSATFAATLYASPAAFFLSGGGGYCVGGVGLELILDGSETGFDYELFLNGTSTGMIMAGTGDSLSFGYQTDVGTYDVTGYSVNCSAQMNGQPYINIIFNPGDAGTPDGPGNVCNDAISEYTTTGSLNADTLIWTLSPPEAGAMIISTDMLTVEIDWTDTFVGMADLSVFGSNDCGDGDMASTEINVNETPSPEISGLALVCEDDLADYSTSDNTGSFYSWDVSGGIITAGAGTYQITVEWGDAGAGYVAVTEDNGGCSGDSEQYDVTIEDCVGIGEQSLKEIAVYPNPASSILNVSIPGQTNVNVRIVNMIGQVMIDLGNNKMESSELSININDLENGIYFLHIIGDDGRAYISKFIKSE